MPAISTKLTLSSAAQSANVVLADIDLIKGALYGVSTESDLDNINGNYLQDGQLMYVQDVSKFFSLAITYEGFDTVYTWSEVTLGASGAITSDDTGSFVLASQTGSFLTSADTASFITSDDTGSFLTALDTGSFLTSEDTSSFVLVSETSSMSVATASFIDPTFISASAAASGFGSGGGSGVGGIFIQTGSFYATTNDLQVTGSMTISNGSLILNEYDSLPGVDRGGIIFSNGAFYIGVD